MLNFVITVGVSLAIGLIVGWVLGALLSQSQIRKLQMQLDQSRERVTQVDELMSGLRRKLNDTEVQLRQVELAIQQPNPEVELTRQQTQDMQDKCDQAMARLQQAQSELDQARQQVTLFQAQAGTLRVRLSQMESDVVQARQRAAVAEARVQETLADLRTAQAQVQDSQTQLEQAAERIYQLERDLESVRSLSTLPPPGEVEIPSLSVIPGPQAVAELVETPQIEVDEMPEKALEFAAELAAPTDLPEAVALGSELDEIQPEVTAPSLVDLTESLPAEPKPVEPMEAEPPEPAPPELQVDDLIEAYCVKCRVKRPMLDPHQTMLANERPAMKGACPECGTTLFRFVKRR